MSRLGDQLAAADLTVSRPSRLRPPLTPARRDRLRAALDGRTLTPVRRTSPAARRSRLLATPLLAAPAPSSAAPAPAAAQAYEDVTPVATPPGTPPPGSGFGRQVAGSAQEQGLRWVFGSLRFGMICCETFGVITGV